MVRADEAVEAAFEAARGVRGRDLKEAALVSLALHGARTWDARPFLAVDGELASRGRAALQDAGRKDLALRVDLWAADAGKVPKSTPAVEAYLRAKAWAEGGMGRRDLGWIRGVPSESALRAEVSERLLLHAERMGGAGAAFAAAALEAELAEVPAPEAFPRVLRAAALAASPAVIARTQEGLGMGARGGASKEALLDGERLAAALQVELERAKGGSGAVVAEGAARALAGAQPAVRWALLAALAGRVGAEGSRDRAVALVDPIIAEKSAAVGLARAPFLTAVSVRLAFPPHDLWARAWSAKEQEFDPAERAFAAAAATRAIKSPRLALDALEVLFDPDDHLAMLKKDQTAPLATMLVREGARAAAAEGDARGIVDLEGHVKKIGTRVEWEAYLRGLIVEGAAHLAAWHGDEDAWGAALVVANARRLPPFERAKLEIRAACEFVRASEAPRREGPLADLLFGGPPRTPAPQRES